MKALWRWALLCLYIFLIYSTLGLVKDWVQILYKYRLVQTMTALTVVLFLSFSIVWGWQDASTRHRLGRIGIGLFLAMVAFSLEFPVERIHIVEYGLIGITLGWAFAGINRWPKWWPLAVILVWMVGWGDELIQAVLPSRVYDVRDIVLNGVSGMAGLYIFETQYKKGCKDHPP